VAHRFLDPAKASEFISVPTMGKVEGPAVVTPSANPPAAISPAVKSVGK